MKLNPDCIRDILLTVEDVTSPHVFMNYPDEYPRLSNYSQDEVIYHIKQCDMSGFFTKVSWYIGGGCSIIDLTPDGHKFIADIRSDNVWNKTKDIAKNVGSFSLNTLSQIATNVITELISGKFH